MEAQHRSTDSGPSDGPGPEGLTDEGFFLAAVAWEIRRAERSREAFVLAAIEGSPSDPSMIGSAILRTVRGCDLVVRIAENRFAALLLGTQPEHLPAFRRRLEDALRQGESGEHTLLIGAAGYPANGTSAEALLRAATAALEESGQDPHGGVDPPAQAASRTPQGKGTVLVVDDDARNRKVLRSLLLSEEYGVVEAENGEQALERLRDAGVDLVLLDVMMPGMNGFEVCRRAKSVESTRGIPIILVTALDDSQSRIQGIEAGADDFLTKPIQFEELCARSASLIRLKRVNSNMTNVENVLLSLAAAVEAKDRYTQGHTDRAARLAMNLGHRLGLSPEDVNCLRIGGILHDIGKIGVPESILNKPGPLTDEEWQQMKRHPEIGYRICESLSKTLGQALEVIRHHHEKLDGSSYPDGLRCDEVSLASRIMGVVDIYDALITDRPYRPAMSDQRAFAILREEASAGKLDGRVVEALIQEVQKPS